MRIYSSAVNVHLYLSTIQWIATRTEKATEQGVSRLPLVSSPAPPNARSGGGVVEGEGRRGKEARANIGRAPVARAKIGMRAQVLMPDSIEHGCTMQH